MPTLLRGRSRAATIAALGLLTLVLRRLTADESYVGTKVDEQKAPHSRLYADSVRHKVSAGGLGDLTPTHPKGGDLAEFLVFAGYLYRF